MVGHYTAGRAAGSRALNMGRCRARVAICIDGSVDPSEPVKHHMHLPHICSVPTETSCLRARSNARIHRQGYVPIHCPKLCRTQTRALHRRQASDTTSSVPTRTYSAALDMSSEDSSIGAGMAAGLPGEVGADLPPLFSSTQSTHRGRDRKSHHGYGRQSEDSLAKDVSLETLDRERGTSKYAAHLHAHAPPIQLRQFNSGQSTSHHTIPRYQEAPGTVMPNLYTQSAHCEERPRYSAPSS